MLLEDINTLVLSGGATRGFALLGAIQFIQDRKLLGKVRKYIGTSIGAIIGYLICIGYSPVEIMVILCQNNFLDKLSKFDITQVVQGGGVVSFSILQEILEKLTIEKIGRFITLGELRDQFGMILVCATFNYSKNEIQYMTPENRPDIPCLVALRMSASLPFLFEPFRYEGSLYIDGGIVENLPINAVAEQDKAIALRLHISLGEKGNFLDYAIDIMTIPVHKLEEIYLKRLSGENCVVIDIPTTGNWFHFSLNNTEKFNLFSIGYNRLKEIYDTPGRGSDPES